MCRRCSRGSHPHLMQNRRADGCRRAFLTLNCLCSRALFGWLGAGLGGRRRARAWSARGAPRFGQCGRARNRRGAVAGRQNGPALHATPAPMCAVILHVTRGPCGRLARVGVQSRVEWCFPKWAEVLCSLTCLLEAHTKITILPPTRRSRTTGEPILQLVCHEILSESCRWTTIIHAVTVESKTKRIILLLSQSVSD